jgi:quercetin dioxygenase-like cupin family protein
MIEEVYRLSGGSEKVIEKVLLDENIHYLHMILNPGDALPVHYTNATLYMTVVRGVLSIRLEEEEGRTYEAGTLLKLPFHTKMDVSNQDAGQLELIVVKHNPVI